MSRLDYDFNQWSVLSFVIKKLYVYLFMAKQGMYLVILMYFMQVYFHLLWSGNKFTDFLAFLNFLSALHAGPTHVNYQEKQKDSKSQDKTPFENKRRKSDY